MRNINRYEKKKFSFSLMDVIKDVLIAIAASFPLYLGMGRVGFIWAVPFFIAAVIGDIVRKYTKPDAIISKGTAANILKNKLYWEIGPQLYAILFFLLFIFGVLRIPSKSDFQLSDSYKTKTVQDNNTKYRD